MSVKLKIVAVILLMAVVTVVATVTATRMVSAAAPTVVLSSGTTRYAAVSSTTLLSPAGLGAAFVDVPALSQSFTVPSGKKADVLIYFCGETRTSDLITVRGVVVTGAGTVIASPPQMKLQDPSVVADLVSRCANFYRQGVSGAVTVKIQWRGMGGPSQMQNRSMILIFNIY